jgi:hypothetical protein
MYFTFNLLSIKPLEVSSITCSSLGATAQTAFGILRAYNVSWLWHDCSAITTVYTKCVCAAAPEDEKVMLETCRGP